MRGHDEQTTHMFSYLSPEQRVPANHPLRAVRALTDEALHTMSRRFAGLYATTGRPSIPPEQLLRALLLQVLYTVRSERLLMEEFNYNLLFRWFVGLVVGCHTGSSGAGPGAPGGRDLDATARVPTWRCSNANAREMPRFRSSR